MIIKELFKVFDNEIWKELKILKDYFEIKQIDDLFLNKLLKKIKHLNKK